MSFPKTDFQKQSFFPLLNRQLRRLSEQYYSCYRLLMYKFCKKQRNTTVDIIYITHDTSADAGCAASPCKLKINMCRLHPLACILVLLDQRTKLTKINYEQRRIVNCYNNLQKDSVDSIDSFEIVYSVFLIDQSVQQYNLYIY